MKNKGICYLSAFLAALFLWNLLIAPAWAIDSITPNSLEKSGRYHGYKIGKIAYSGAAVVVTQGTQILLVKATDMQIWSGKWHSIQQRPLFVSAL